MTLTARLMPGETLGDRVLRVDHAGEHGAVCTYAAQLRIARWRAPAMVAEIEGFLAHERRHRALFAEEIARRGQTRCWSYRLCGALGTLLGVMTGLFGRTGIAAATLGIERVVLRHLEAQRVALSVDDPAAAAVIAQIVEDERSHHDEALGQARGWMAALLVAPIAAATEAVIWIGMHR